MNNRLNEFCICGGAKYRCLFTALPFTIVQCISCGQIRTKTPVGVMRKYEYQLDDITVYLEKEQMFREIFRNIIGFIKKFRTNGTLVDIGANVGLLVTEANRAGFRAIGFEPSKAAVVAAKKYFGVNLIESEFNAKTFKRNKNCIPDLAEDDGVFRAVNIVVINHVLEHVPEPKKLLENITDILCSYGLLVIGVPNFGGIIAKIKKDKWQNLNPQQHLWHFTLSTLDNFVKPLGYSRIGVRTENHDRNMHPIWKRPIYWFLDTIALLTNKGEAILVIYRKK